MKIIAWNINHRIREKAIPHQMVEAIVSLAPDVIVLTEYVHGPSRDSFLAKLAKHGFGHWCVSDPRPQENQVLIAARTDLERGPIRAPEIDRSMPSNVLHVHLPQNGVEILGLRVPDYSKDAKTKRACWDWILETAASMQDRPFVIIGDFNTDPKYSRSRCGDRIKRLVDEGWQLASPPDGSSFWTLKGDAVRIDHAFVSKLLAVERASYATKLDRYVFVGKEPGALSDHAALSVDIMLRFDGVGREDGGRLSQPRERRVSGQEQIEKILQVMSAGDKLAKFLKEGLEVFLSRLLTMKADRIVQRPTAT